MSSRDGRRIAVTGDNALADGVAAGLQSLGARVVLLDAAYEAEDDVRAAMEAARDALDGRIDQVVHAWMEPALLDARVFAEVSEETWAIACEHTLEVAWWTARQASPSLRDTRGSLVFLVPTIGMAGGAGFAMLAAVAEGIRVLGKGCGRQWGAAGVTCNTVAVAPHHWTGDAAGAELTRNITLSTPAFGDEGDAAGDLAPLVALLGDDDAHFLTAATMVADGGTWMGL
jgi:NAD(P)-dependent dehydrogenase (short-subunit alcohol dehydrogenase family)